MDYLLRRLPFFVMNCTVRYEEPLAEKVRREKCMVSLTSRWLPSNKDEKRMSLESFIEIIVSIQLPGQSQGLLYKHPCHYFIN